MPACTSCGQDNPEIARFCLACGSALAAAAPPRELRKTVTVVFCDVSGSTALGERLDPEAVRRVLERYFEEMRAVLERHGGTVEKFIGDAVMAVFGVPVVHEDDALRAVRAAVEMRDRLARLNEELSADWNVSVAARIGVNTGEVVTADGRGAQRLATGDAVNVAARLEQAATPGEILIGEHTYRLVRHAVDAQRLELSVKGKHDPVVAFRLAALAAGAERGLASPLVGRQRELRRLRDAFEAAVADRSCQLFTLLGPAGVGKSRLVAEFLSRLGDDATVLRGRCLPYGDGITYRPVVEAVREAAGLAESHPGDVARARIAEVVTGQPDAAAIAARVAELVGADEAGAGRDEAFWAVRKFFAALAHERPLVLVFDDVHWGEPTFLDLLEHITDWSRDVPMLVLCVARPELLEERPGWGGGKLGATTLLLQPLADDEAVRLIANVLGETPLAGEIQERIGEAAGGNPLFVEEMVAMLIDEGVLERRNGGWATAGDLGRVSVPPTIHALLAARLDRLAEGERIVVERAAVEGKVFHSGAVRELAPEALRAHTDEHLASLVRKDLVRPDTSPTAGGDAYRFRHLLVRDAAYEAIPKGLRAELHERFAGWLERRDDRAADADELVGYHLEQAVRYRAELAPLDDADRAVGMRAADRLTAAARRASLRGDMSAAVSLFRRAIALVPADDWRRSDLLAELSHTLLSTDLDEMRKVMDEAGDVAARTGHRRGEALVRLLRLLYRIRADVPPSPEEAEREVEQAIDVFSHYGDDLGLARCYLTLAGAVMWRLDAARLEQLVERVWTHARRAGAAEEAMYASSNLLFMLVAGPTAVPDAIARCHDLEAGAVSPRLEAAALRTLGELHARLGDFEEARRVLHEARAVQEDLGIPYTRAVTVLAEGEVELLADAPARAEPLLREAYDQVRFGHSRALVAAHLARALLELGRDSEAAALLAAAELEAPPGHVIWTTSADALGARLAARRGDLGEAVALARNAVSAADPTDGLELQADVRIDLAEVLDAAGEHEAAAAAAEEALRRYERKGHAVGAARARRLLRRLPAAGPSSS